MSPMGNSAQWFGEKVSRVICCIYTIALVAIDSHNIVQKANGHALGFAQILQSLRDIGLNCEPRSLGICLNEHLAGPKNVL
jgi:hypothetical protein